ncbi:RNA polymerase sigma factor [Pimelobacter simplex]|uniref:Putative RNA polymerase sigma factor n=1 Tax=Nocardioides simplex TaxID=2045 RepID=A0A0A1DTX2_NOCSI|nr:SigE family RNA polymerase sigma factor [Pimelobacter simplex]AIY20027.2 putative RNA polymerase sigma factor [Pimelobacter simplex]GEB15887.1 DNA-directed RNA polymerase sigma-70 factor [Pimelobacter simplex]SFN12352.1 RNA polymerase sigma-70 factor, sigma-E family [Pimelobacter simplex]
MALVYLGVRDQDEAAFTAFVATSGDRLLRFARLLVLDHGEAEDALQEALTRLARHWHRTETPEAYTRTILVNLARDRGRRRHLVPTPAEDVEPERGAPAPDPADALAARRRLDVLLASLPPKQRATVVLRVVEDLSEAETARIMGCAAGTVRSNLSRALGSLRDRLGDSLEAMS